MDAKVKMASNGRVVHLASVAAIAFAMLFLWEGSGIGSADVITDAKQSGTAVWRVHNFTGSTLTSGSIEKWDEGSPSSNIDFTYLESGGNIESQYRTSLVDRNVTEVHGVCYLQHRFRMDPQYTARGRWRDVFIFADTHANLFITPQGGGDDRALERFGTC